MSTADLSTQNGWQRAACSLGLGFSHAGIAVCAAHGRGRFCGFGDRACHRLGAPALGSNVGMGIEPTHARAFAIARYLPFRWLGGRGGLCRGLGATGARFAVDTGLGNGVVGGAVCVLGEFAAWLHGVWLHAGGLFGGDGGFAAPRPCGRHLAIGLGSHADRGHRGGHSAVHFLVFCASPQDRRADCTKSPRFGGRAAEHGSGTAPNQHPRS